MSSTVIYLRGAKFNNSELPKIWPYTVNNFIASGLVFAVMPRDNLASMTDLSGNNVHFTQVGSPVWYPTGVKGQANNQSGRVPTGFYTSAMETHNFTTLCVSRKHRDMTEDNTALTSDNFHTNLRLNSHCQGLNPVVGTSCYSNPQPASDGNANNFRIGYFACQSMGFDPSGNSASYARGVVLPGDISRVNNKVGPWVLTVGTVDAAKAEMLGYVYSTALAEPWLSSALNPQTSPATVGQNTFSGRQIIGQHWNLLVPDVLSTSAYSGGCEEIAAAAIWNRALSADEVAAQYAILKNLLKQERGILV